MYKKMLKRTKGIIAGAFIIVGMLGSTFPVHAANVKDTTVSIRVDSVSSSFKTASTRPKENNSKVYVKLTSSPTTYIQVRTYGNRKTSSTYYNETNGITATVQRSIPSSITNFIYENRNKKSGNSTLRAQLRLRSNTSASGIVTGVWSPDSTKNYTVVN